MVSTRALVDNAGSLKELGFMDTRLPMVLGLPDGRSKLQWVIAPPHGKARVPRILAPPHGRLTHKF